MKNWVTLIHFKVKDTSWKIDLDDIVDEFDSRHDKRRIKLHWGDDDIKFERGLRRNLCENYVCSLTICLNSFGLEVVRVSRMRGQSQKKLRVEKSAFENQSEENSVWIIKWKTLLGIFCKVRFTPAAASCYQVHADPHVSAALLCYLDAIGT